jgi:hypothetical protein
MNLREERIMSSMELNNLKEANIREELGDDCLQENFTTIELNSLESRVFFMK